MAIFLQSKSASHQIHKGWVAKVVGTDPKFKFAREFIKPTKLDQSRSMRKIYAEWIVGEGVYEVRGLTSHEDGFYRVLGGNVERITEDEVIAELEGDGAAEDVAEDVAEEAAAASPVRQIENFNLAVEYWTLRAQRPGREDPEKLALAEKLARYRDALASVDHDVDGRRIARELGLDWFFVDSIAYRRTDEFRSAVESLRAKRSAGL